MLENADKRDNGDSTGRVAPNNESVERTDQNATYSLKVKKEFVLEGRAPSLGELPPENNRDARQEGEDDDGGSKKKRKNRRGKKRNLDRIVPNTEKVCLAVLRGDSCPYGETCKFSHDMKSYLASRPPDFEITTVEGGCPTFHETGYCPFGAMCRLGSCHLIKSTGENVKNEIVLAPPAIQNILPKEIVMQLRKRTYPFKCKRKHDKGSQAKQGKNDEESSKPNATSASLGESKVAADSDEKPLKVILPDAFRPSLVPNPDRNDAIPKTRRLIDFSNKVYVAPLTTVGNLPFRRIMKKFGADITCGEMAVASNLLDGRPSEWALLKRHPEEDVFGVQIAAGYPDQFIRTCEVIEAHMHVDFVDINMGCPLDIICDKGCGSALMKRDHLLKASLEGMTSTLTCPVTIKMRTGMSLAKPFAHELVPKIQSWGIDGINAIMVHGRSKVQRYQKLADWDYISTVAQSQDPNFPSLNVIGNGDIFSYTDYEEKIAREGVSATAMLGRGALIKPWLPTEIKERRHWDISATERLDILKDFVRFGLFHWGSDEQGVNNTRRFLLEWLSFLYRYVPVGLLEVLPQQMNMRPPTFMCGRSDLETLFLSAHSADWIKITEMLLGPVPDGFQFEPKHKAAG